jgi:DNA repair protein RadA
MPSRLKEVTMEHIPNITSDVIEKLKKLNINCVYQLAVQSPLELALEHENTSLNIETASTLVINARKILTENKVLALS